MASTEVARIESDTLALYNNMREITRYSPSCPHWRGQDLSASGPSPYFAMDSAEIALQWFNTGVMAEGVRELTPEEASRGCGCQRRPTEQPA